MRKHAMILALVMALIMGLVCIGCPGSLGTVDATGASNIAKFGDDGDVGEPVFTLSEILEELGEGSVDEDTIADTGFLALAGSPTTVITNDGGVLVIRFTTTQNWGEGLDVNYIDEETGEGFEFEEGDTITVTGKAINFATSDNGGASWATPALFLKVPAGADNPKVSAETTANTPFELKYKLTALDIVAIGESSPPGIRVGGRAIGVQFQINDIVISR
jgi:hypothetical protein